MMGAALNADGNRNGIVDAGDYEVWRANFGQSAGGAGVSTTPLVSFGVPEPATSLLLTIVCAIAGLMRISRQ